MVLAQNKQTKKNADISAKNHFGIPDTYIHRYVTDVAIQVLALSQQVLLDDLSQCAFHLQILHYHISRHSLQHMALFSSCSLYYLFLLCSLVFPIIYSNSVLFAVVSEAHLTSLSLSFSVVYFLDPCWQINS